MVRKQIEISLPNSKIEKITQLDEISPDFNAFINYLNNKFPDWEEFILTNHSANQIKMVKLSERIVFLEKPLQLGMLMQYLNMRYNGWKRVGITNKDFKLIDKKDIKVGMLVRSSSSNISPYCYVIKIDEAKNNLLGCQESPKEWKCNIDKVDKFKFRILNDCLLNGPEFCDHEWPESKAVAERKKQ